MADLAELIKELERLVKVIVSEDDCTVGVIDDAVRFLNALKELKRKKTPSRSATVFVTEDSAPAEFKCPISKMLMSDPVVLASGTTFDRPVIERWLREGHQTCPHTMEVLPHCVLAPNLLAREIISQWCKDNRINLPPPIGCDDESALTDGCDDESALTDGDRDRLTALLEKMSSSPFVSEKREAAKELRLLTKNVPSFRMFFCESSEIITQLLNPLSQDIVITHTDIQEDLVTTIFNISVHEKNKRLLVENPLSIPILIQSLRFGTMDTRRNAAAALFCLATIDLNRILIGKSGAMKPLIDLLGIGQLFPLAMKDAAAAIYQLCIVSENQERAINEGVVKVIMGNIMDGLLIDEMLPILGLFSNRRQAIREMVKLDAVHIFLNIIKNNSYEANRENCSALLYTICSASRTKLMEVSDDEEANGTISRLASNGSSRAQRKASGILKLLKSA